MLIAGRFFWPRKPTSVHNAVIYVAIVWLFSLFCSHTCVPNAEVTNNLSAIKLACYWKFLPADGLRCNETWPRFILFLSLVEFLYTSVDHSQKRHNRQLFHVAVPKHLRARHVPDDAYRKFNCLMNNNKIVPRRFPSRELDCSGVATKLFAIISYVRRSICTLWVGVLSEVGAPDKAVNFGKPIVADVYR